MLFSSHYTADLSISDEMLHVMAFSVVSYNKMCKVKHTEQ